MTFRLSSSKIPYIIGKPLPLLLSVQVILNEILYPGIIRRPSVIDDQRCANDAPLIDEYYSNHLLCCISSSRSKNRDNRKERCTFHRLLLSLIHPHCHSVRRRGISVFNLPPLMLCMLVNVLRLLT
jgi:hypothetical protein